MLETKNLSQITLKKLISGANYTPMIPVKIAIHYNLSIFYSTGHFTEFLGECLHRCHDIYKASWFYKCREKLKGNGDKKERLRDTCSIALPLVKLATWA